MSWVLCSSLFFSEYTLRPSVSVCPDCPNVSVPAPLGRSYSFTEIVTTPKMKFGYTTRTLWIPLPEWKVLGPWPHWISSIAHILTHLGSYLVLRVSYFRRLSFHDRKINSTLVRSIVRLYPHDLSPRSSRSIVWLQITVFLTSIPVLEFIGWSSV